MEKVIKKHLTITSANRGVEKLEHEIYSKDKGTAAFKFTIDELTASKVLCLFYFKDTKRYRTVEATIEGNTITVPFDSTLITTSEPVIGYVYFEKVEQATDVYSFAFNVRVSAIDRVQETPLIERATGRIVDVENIVTKQELDALFAKIKEQGGTYDDSNLRAELSNKVDRTEISQITGKIEALEQKTDKDTIYNDEPLKSRLSALESKAEIDTSAFATKRELENKVERSEISRISSDVELLKAKTDKDTVYDDSALKQRVSALESKPAIDTSSLVTKQELNSKGYLTEHQPLTEYAKKSELPQAYNDTELKSRVQTLETKTETLATKEELNAIQLRAGERGERGEKGEKGDQGLQGVQGIQGERGENGRDGRDGVGIPQKLSIDGNVVTLSDGGGSITLPMATATPSGTSGKVSEYEIHGTGMPNGNVVAPVGTTYVDTAVTNGALKWIKQSGTGNTGWKVLIGDTGWRTLKSVSRVGNSFIKIRRVNNLVTYNFGGLQYGWFGIIRRNGPGYVRHNSTGDRGVKVVGTGGIPEGFRSESSLVGPTFKDDGRPYGMWYLGGKSDSNFMQFTFNENIPTDKDIGDIRVSPVSYITEDDWPTTLP